MPPRRKRTTRGRVDAVLGQTDQVGAPVPERAEVCESSRTELVRR